MTDVENPNDEPTPLTLDSTVLQRIAQLICGDDTSPKYRKTYEIEQFFKVLGVTDLPEIEHARVPWVLDILTAAQHHTPDLIERVVLRLADPREYLDEPAAQEEVVAELNRLLALDGLAVVNCDTRPQLVSATLAQSGDRLQADYLVDFTIQPADVLTNADVIELVDDRIDKARRCADAEAYIAGVIILGGVLEMVLLHFAKEHASAEEPQDGPPGQKRRQRTPSLHDLIELAHKNGWIRTDIKGYADVLRNHRNLVHPDLQRRENYSPNRHNMILSWNIVAATFDDLHTALRA